MSEGWRGSGPFHFLGHFPLSVRRRQWLVMGGNLCSSPHTFLSPAGDKRKKFFIFPFCPFPPFGPPFPPFSVWNWTENLKICCFSTYFVEFCCPLIFRIFRFLGASLAAPPPSVLHPPFQLESILILPLPQWGPLNNRVLESFFYLLPPAGEGGGGGKGRENPSLTLFLLRRCLSENLTR